MVSEAEDMAGYSCLLVFALILMSVFASALRPLTTVSEPPEPAGRGISEVDDNWNIEVVVAAEAVVPHADGNLKVETDGDEVKTDRLWDVNGEGTLEGDAKAASDAIGALPMPLYPMPVPGADERFHFNLGPFGFAGGVNIGLLNPGGGIPFSEQYVVVSPPHYVPASLVPFPYWSPYQQSTSENGQP